MKKRYLYSLLFGMPGLFVSGMISLILFGAAIGILWIFVFGDNPWPMSSENILSIMLALVFLILWAVFIVAGYVVGKKLEKDPLLNRAHILISGGVTLLFILFIVLQQLSVGNLGAKSHSTLCSEFCIQRGYSASGTPPANSSDRTCSCYDNLGNEALKVPLESMGSGSK